MASMVSSSATSRLVKSQRLLLKLVTDDALRERLAENGFAMAKKYGWSDISTKIIDTYKKLSS